MSYFTDVLPNLASEGQMQSLFKNSSILGFTFKLFTETNQIIPLVDNPAFAQISRVILTLLVVGGSIFLIAQSQKDKTNQSSTTRFDLEYGLVILVALMFSSTLWVSGMPQLLICYQLLLKQQLRGYVRWLVWISFGIVTYYFLFLLAFQSGNQLHALILSIGFYGVFVLWGVCAFQTWRVIKSSRILS